jgi:hypothetical protein
MRDLERIIPAVFGWEEGVQSRFTFEYNNNADLIDQEGSVLPDVDLEDLARNSITSRVFEYGPSWTVMVLLMSRHTAVHTTVPAQGADEQEPQPRCLAGEGASPPLAVEGPLRYRRFLDTLEEARSKNSILTMTSDTVKPIDPNAVELAVSYLGQDFDEAAFDAAACTKAIQTVYKP